MFHNFKQRAKKQKRKTIYQIQLKSSLKNSILCNFLVFNNSQNFLTIENANIWEK